MSKEEVKTRTEQKQKQTKLSTIFNSFIIEHFRYFVLSIFYKCVCVFVSPNVALDVLKKCHQNKMQRVMVKPIIKENKNIDFSECVRRTHKKIEIQSNKTK